MTKPLASPLSRIASSEALRSRIAPLHRWVRRHPISSVLLVAGSYLLWRSWWNLNQTALWQGDAGFELIELWDITLRGDWLHLGAPSSTGGFRMPPFFYHLLLPAAWVGWFNPIVLIGYSGLLNTLSLLPLYLLTRELTRSKAAGLAAALLLALTSWMLPIQRSLWSIHPVFLFLAGFLCVGVLLTRHRYRLAGVFGFLTGAAASFHAFLFFIGPLGWLWALWLWGKSRQWLSWAWFAAGFLLSTGAYWLSELSTGWANWRGFQADLARAQTVESTLGQRVGERFQSLLELVATQLNPSQAVPDWATAAWFGWVVGLSLLWLLGLMVWRHRTKGWSSPAWFVLLYLLIGGGQLVVYRGPFEAWYLVPLWLLPALLVGGLVAGGAWLVRRWAIPRTTWLFVVTLLTVGFGLWHLLASWQPFLSRSTALPFATSYYHDVNLLTRRVEELAGNQPFRFHNTSFPLVQTDFTSLFYLHRANFDPQAERLFILVNRELNPDLSHYEDCLSRSEQVDTYQTYELFEIHDLTCPNLPFTTVYYPWPNLDSRI